MRREGRKRILKKRKRKKSDNGVYKCEKSLILLKSFGEHNLIDVLFLQWIVREFLDQIY